jgi:hypothetical protein
LQDPLLRRARKKRRPLTLPIYETEVIRPRHVDSGIQTYEVDDSPDFADDYVMPEDEEITQFGETHFGRIATRYLLQYVRGDRSIDKVYGIRRETNGTFMIGDLPLTVDENGDVPVLGVTYEGTEGLWELLTKTNVDQSLVTPYDMRLCKRILESTNGHLSDNDASGHIKILRGPKYRDVISKLFPMESRRRRRSRQRWTNFRQ